jgi:hypothetical protein
MKSDPVQRSVFVPSKGYIPEETMTAEDFEEVEALRRELRLAGLTKEERKWLDQMPRQDRTREGELAE